MEYRVLLIEDNHDLADLVSMHLADIGCEVVWASSGDQGYREARAGEFDVIILDLMLPGIEGLELCRRLRGAEDFTPILMLTAKSSELDRVLGLEMGADDYMTKPFSFRELQARVRAIFRRSEVFRQQQRPSGEVIRTGAMTIDVDKRTVTIDSTSVELTAREFDLLVQFARRPGHVYTRAQLLDQVWGYSHEGYEHTVNSHINRLRAKIEDDPAKPAYVLTVWGVGYKFNDRLVGGGDVSHPV